MSSHHVSLTLDGDRVVAVSAETVAAALYDEPRDLEPFEQEFLLAVRYISMDCAKVCGAAVKAFGRDAKATLAVEFTTKRRRDERFKAALTKYYAQVEQREFAA